jgi:raffinose/stachyose/melibiose transport system substrate-binding protein
MKKSVYRILSAFLVLAMCVALFGGCSKTTTPSAKKSVTLTVLANQDYVTKPYMKAIWANYEAASGNKLDIQAVPTDSGEQVMETKFATGDIPDIFMHFGGYALTPYAAAKNFVDFSDASWVKDVEPYVLDQTKVDGKVYGIPFWEASISGMLYNKDIFTKLSITVPKTQEEFVAACDKIKASGVTPIYMAFKDVWPLLYQFPVDTMVTDASVLSKLNSNQLTYAGIPAFTTMLEFYKTLATNGYLGKMYTANTWDGLPDALGTGKYAMAYCWDSWLSSDLEPKYPGFSSKIGIMPAFLGTPDTGTYEGPNCCLTMVNKNGKNVAAAKDFVAFMATPANYNKAFAGVFTSPVFKGETSNVTSQQYTDSIDSITAVARASTANPSIIGFDQVTAAKYIQDLMLGTITVAQCVKSMDADRIGKAQAQKVSGF